MNKIKNNSNKLKQRKLLNRYTVFGEIGMVEQYRTKTCISVTSTELVYWDINTYNKYIFFQNIINFIFLIIIFFI